MVQTMLEHNQNMHTSSLLHSNKSTWKSAVLASITVHYSSNQIKVSLFIKYCIFSPKKFILVNVPFY